MTEYGGLPFGTLSNDQLQVDYLTTTGPRIIGLHALGMEGNLLAYTPDVHWAVPHGEFYLRGGHRLWKAPEDAHYICPEDGLTVKEHDGVTLRSPVDVSGLEKEIAIRLDGHCVHLSQKVTWHGNQPITLAPWGITQLRLGGLGILPLSTEADGLAPNRNFVLWSYTSLDDTRLELQDDFILLHGEASGNATKIGNYNTYGWTAYAMGNGLFVKHFEVVEEGNFPDIGCNVEAYVKNVCLELETLGPLKTLQMGESAVLNEVWEVLIGDFPPNIETAHIIGEML